MPCSAMRWPSSVRFVAKAADMKATRELAALLTPRKGEQGGCAHPASRLWCWQAIDGVWCVACCDCGAVLRGGAQLNNEQEGNEDGS